jgi:hypothetical protein
LRATFASSAARDGNGAENESKAPNRSEPSRSKGARIAGLRRRYGLRLSIRLRAVA